MNLKERAVVLAVAPTSRGFGYILFVARSQPLDWGVKETRCDKNRQALAKIDGMLRLIMPAILVLEDRAHRSCRRSLRVKRLLKQIAALAQTRGVPAASYSRQHIRQTFRAKGKSKDAIAAAVAEAVPALRPWLPRRRRIWESEHHSMAIFEAAALAMVHYAALRASVESQSGQAALL